MVSSFTIKNSVSKFLKGFACNRLFTKEIAQFYTHKFKSNGYKRTSLLSIQQNFWLKYIIT